MSHTEQLFNLAGVLAALGGLSWLDLTSINGRHYVLRGGWWRAMRWTGLAGICIASFWKEEAGLNPWIAWAALGCGLFVLFGSARRACRPAL